MIHFFLSLAPETGQQWFALSGDVLAAGVLIWKTVYDLYLNPRKFQKELDAHVAAATAAKNKRERSDDSTATAFFVLAISFCLSIVGDVL